MQNSELIHALSFFPQNAEVHYSDYGLYVALMDMAHYVDYEVEGKQIRVLEVPSYELSMLSEEELQNLPWLKDPTWLTRHHRDNFK